MNEATPEQMDAYAALFGGPVGSFPVNPVGPSDLQGGQPAGGIFGNTPAPPPQHHDPTEIYERKLREQAAADPARFAIAAPPSPRAGLAPGATSGEHVDLTTGEVSIDGQVFPLTETEHRRIVAIVLAGLRRHNSARLGVLKSQLVLEVPPKPRKRRKKAVRGVPRESGSTEASVAGSPAADTVYPVRKARNAGNKKVRQVQVTAPSGADGNGS